MDREDEYLLGIARIDYVRDLLNSTPRIAEPRVEGDLESSETREALLEEFFAYYAPILERAMDSLGVDPTPTHRKSVIDSVAVNLRLQAPKGPNRKRLNARRTAGSVMGYYLNQLMDRAGLEVIRFYHANLDEKKFPNEVMWEAAFATAKQFGFSDERSALRQKLERQRDLTGSKYPIPRGN